MNQSLSGIPSIYFCGHEHCQPGHSFGPAVRPHYLIHVVLSGKGIFKHQGHTYSLKSGDSFLIKPMDSTYYEADRNNPWEYAWIGFNGQEIPALLNQTCFQDSCIFICPPDSERKLNLRTLMHSILNTFSSANYNPFTLTGLFLELLGLMTGPSVVEGNSYSTQYVKPRNGLYEKLITATTSVFRTLQPLLELIGLISIVFLWNSRKFLRNNICFN